MIPLAGGVQRGKVRHLRSSSLGVSALILFCQMGGGIYILIDCQYT